MEEARIGVYICACGTNIADTVDVAAVTEMAALLPGVAVARQHKYTCSEPGQQMIQDDIRDLGINRVVVASCTPRMHEPTFRRALAEAGMNPYYFEMANIREHVSWVVHDLPRLAPEHAGPTTEVTSTPLADAAPATPSCAPWSTAAGRSTGPSRRK